MFKLIAATGLVLVAALLHSFYIDYELNGQNYIFFWRATTAQHEEYLAWRASGLITPDTQQTVKLPSDQEVSRKKEVFLADRSNCIPNRYPSSWPAWKKWDFLLDPDNYNCKRPWVAPKQNVLVEVHKGTTYEEALETLRNSNTRTYYGMTPSAASGGQLHPVSAATVRSLWLGVLLPCAMVLTAIGLLASFITSILRKNSYKKLDEHDKGVNPTPSKFAPEIAQGQAHIPSLGNLLRAHFGPHLGVRDGSATRADPLVITEMIDYASIEYDVANFLLRGKEFKLEAQRLHHVDGKAIDELEFLIVDPDLKDQKIVHRFFFDITIGFNKLGH